MKRFLLISPKNRTVYNFRGELIRTLQQQGYEVWVTGPNQDDIDGINALGVRFVEIPVNKNGVNPLADLGYMNSLRRLMKEIKPDVTLGYTIKPVVYGSMAARLAGVKNVNAMVTGAGYLFIAKTAKARLLKAIGLTLYRIGLGCATNVIFQNPDDRQEFIKNRLVKARKCHVVNGSGVDIKHFVVESMPDAPTFFMLSRLLKSKGVQEYLEAARITKTKYPAAKFYLLGKYETAMQDAIAKEYVEMFIRDGIVERYEETTDVRPYYAQCSVYVLPSYREGTPRTVLEAMAMGRPVITTDVPGCRETVKDGVNGWLVPAQDVNALADRMCRMVEHPDLIGQMGQESRRYCEEKFDVDKVNEAMVKIIERMKE